MQHPIAKGIPAYVQAVKNHSEVHSKYYNGIWTVHYKGHWITNEEYEAMRTKPDEMLKKYIEKGSHIGDKLVCSMSVN